MSTLDELRAGRLAGARELRLRAGLTEFPREIFALADTLEVLDLSGNRLSELPDELGRLRRLKAIFCSGNAFTRLPPALGDCAELSQVGFRGMALREVPAESLPPQLRWLSLTDNQIETLPDALGQRPLLQKLMLSGNRLTRLPQTLACAENLELLRLAANRFDAMPGWVTGLPRLAWLAVAGNPFEAADATAAANGAATDIPWAELKTGALLGEGASGWIHCAQWHQVGAPGPMDVAVKLYKSAMTSDGLPEHEMAACLTAGAHPHLMGAWGRVGGHPSAAPGLVMPLLPTHWRALADPPSLASCSRDVYAPDLRLSPPVLLRIAFSVAGATAHLHACGLLHGDLYAHNTLWDAAHGQALLSDFGAASFLPRNDPHRSLALQRLDVRAWGLLVDEMLRRCETPMPRLAALAAQCVQPRPAERPSMAEALAALIPQVPVDARLSGRHIN